MIATRFLSVFIALGLIVSCDQKDLDHKKNNTKFVLLNSEETNIDFINDVKDQQNFNVLNYT